MAPMPTEVTRPDFIGFAGSDSGAINVSLDHPITMIFDEKMDISTFPNNFSLSSFSGEIGGTFSISSAGDSIVIFTPAENMNTAEVYTASVGGGVRDVNGLSRLSPNVDDIPEENSVFTTGAYAENGFPHVFVSDKLGKIIYQVGEIDKYMKQETLTEASREMRVTPDGSKLLVVNKVNPGVLTVINPQSLELITTVNVGSGPDHIFATNSTAYISDVSGKTVSIVNLNSFSLETTFSFTDGFRPRDIVYSDKTNKIYLSSNLTSDYAKIRVIDANNYDSFYDIEDIMPEKRTEDMEISPDGEYIFLAETQTLNLIILSTSSETVVKTLQADLTRNEDGITTEDAYYLVTNGGGVFKVDYSSLGFTDFTDLGRILSSVGATAQGELLYVVSQVDSTIDLVETSTMQKISEIKVPGVLNEIAVSKLNY
jgi:YVTN family beta-propeller protein